MTPKRFRMLIGDDAYTDSMIEKCHLINTLVSLNENLGIKQPIMEESISDGWYRTDEFPNYAGADIRVVDNIESMVNEANSSEWDFIVSDLQYSERRLGGIEVIKGIKPTNKSIKAIFTSGDNKKELEAVREQAKRLGVNYFVCPTLETSQYSHKTELLGKVLADYLKSKEARI